MITQSRTHTRWIIRRDMEEVLQIDYQCNPLAWEEQDFLSHLRQRNCIGMVLEIGDKVVGFMIYSLHKDHLQIHNLGIDPNYQEYKSELIYKLKSKLSAHRRTSIQMHVAESNLPLLLFLKSQGFQSTSILHDQYQLSDDDTYVMEYKCESIS